MEECAEQTAGMTQAEAPAPAGDLEKAIQAQKAYALDAMARDHESRAKLLKEAANVLREKAGLPQHV